MKKYFIIKIPRARSEMDITEASEASVLGSSPSEHTASSTRRTPPV